MAKTVVQKIFGVWGKKRRTRDLSTDRLSADGAEKLDPIPHAVKLGIRPAKTIDDRIKEILRLSAIKADPNYGYDSEEPDDFESDDPSTVDPMYEFEKHHDRITTLEQELIASKKERDDALAAFQANRNKKRVVSNPKDVTPPREEDGPKDE